MRHVVRGSGDQAALVVSVAHLLSLVYIHNLEAGVSESGQSLFVEYQASAATNPASYDEYGRFRSP